MAELRLYSTPNGGEYVVIVEAEDWDAGDDELQDSIPLPDGMTIWPTDRELTQS